MKPENAPSHKHGKHVNFRNTLPINRFTLAFSYHSIFIPSWGKWTPPFPQHLPWVVRRRHGNTGRWGKSRLRASIEKWEHEEMLKYIRGKNGQK